MDMKNKIINVLVLGILITAFTMSCEKSTSPELNTTTHEAQFDLKKDPWWKRIKVKFKWEGLIGQTQCQGGQCGKCLGFCVYTESTPVTEAYEISEEDSIAGWGTMWVTVSNGDLRCQFEASCDNGDDTVRIIENYYIGDAASESLGYDSVFVKEGAYFIDYSEYEDFGESYWDLRVVDK